MHNSNIAIVNFILKKLRYLSTAKQKKLSIKVRNEEYNYQITSTELFF